MIDVMNKLLIACKDAFDYLRMEDQLDDNERSQVKNLLLEKFESTIIEAEKLLKGNIS